MPGAALPNLHPAVIHFPIALLVVAFLLDVACLALRRNVWLGRAAAMLFVLGAAGAWAAVLTGERAADSLLAVPPQVQPLIGEHHDWAERTAWLFTIVALARLAVAWVDRSKRVAGRLAVRAILLAVAAGGQWMLLGTADRGGGLVYGHGLAVTAAREEAPETALPEPRLTRTEEGGWSWTPLPEDTAALGTVLSAAEGSAAVRAVDGVEGLGLETSGRSLLLLPGEFDDAQVELTVDLSGFQGTVGVAHHARALGDAGSFQVSTQGSAALVFEKAGERELLDEAEAPIPDGPITLAVSAADRHLKGLYDGATVVHGHMPPPAAGGVGLLLDGDGVVRVLALRVIPIAGH